MRPRKIFLLMSFLLFFSTLAACSLIPFGNAPSGDTIGTMVAATVMAGGPAADSAPAATETVEITVSEMPVYPIRVSFVNEAGNLFVWSDGSAAPVQLTTSGDATNAYISFDGNLIAFFRSPDDVNYQLDAINYDGTNLHTLLTSSQIAALPRPTYSIGLMPGQVAWIPGIHTLAMNFKAQFEGPGLAYTEEDAAP